MVDHQPCGVVQYNHPLLPLHMCMHLRTMNTLRLLKRVSFECQLTEVPHRSKLHVQTKYMSRATCYHSPIIQV